MRNFQTVIVHAVKIGKQCLRTDLVCGGPPTKASPLDPIGGIPFPKAPEL